MQVLLVLGSVFVSPVVVYVQLLGLVDDRDFVVFVLDEAGQDARADFAVLNSLALLLLSVDGACLKK